MFRRLGLYGGPVKTAIKVVVLFVVGSVDDDIGFNSSFTRLHPVTRGHGSCLWLLLGYFVAGSTGEGYSVPPASLSKDHGSQL